MIRALWQLLLSVAFVLGTLAPTIGYAQGTPAVADLLKFVPETANAVMVIRVQDLVNSPRGQAEKWRTADNHDLLDGALRIPPWVNLLVRASHISSQSLQGNWTVSLTPRPENLTLETMIKMADANVEKIGDQTVARNRRGYAAEVRPGVIGMMSPPLRQDFARWVRGEFIGDRHPLSPYLQITAANTTAPIVLAYDLQDFFDPLHLQQFLAASPTLAKTPEKQAPLLRLLTQLQGARMAIQVDDQITADFQLNFFTELPPDAAILRELLIEAAGDAGLGLPELEQAEVTVSDKTVSLRMGLSDSSLRLLLTLITAPLPEQQSATMANNTTGTQRTVDVAATQAYYTEMRRLIRDLRSLNRRNAGYDRTATWHDNYARRIREMSTIGVDTRLLQFGANTADRFTALANSLRGVPVDLQALEDKIRVNLNVTTWEPGGVWTAWGYHPAPWEVNSNVLDVRAAQRQAVEQGARDREAIWQAIEKERVEVRDFLNSKYSRDFDNPPRR
ncbi:MAG: hypothetical protein SFX18_16115 [Pirellulales bacterium]|nr:hypothetical protein [Pirellulales bacterium]